jgi:hypothetical protein
MQEQGVCIANIGPRGRRMRLQSGVKALALGAGASAALVLIGAPRWLRLGVFAPFAGGAIGIFQAYEQTCVALAARGTRNMDAGEEQVDDSAADRQIRWQARKVIIEGLISAALLTAVVLALPRRRRG